jgi:hypothetical protein
MEAARAERVLPHRRLREGMQAWEELWRLLADGPHRLASREAAMAETPYTAYSYLEGGPYGRYQCFRAGCR